METDKPGEWPVPFCSETVRRVVVELALAYTVAPNHQIVRVQVVSRYAI